MADELNEIKQSIHIDVRETGADKATQDIDNLNVSISESTTATQNDTKAKKQNEEGFKSLKLQLKEATVLQQKLSAQFGSTSKEAIDAAKNVAKLKDEIGFQKDLVESYNPDEKFRGLTQTAGLAALALGGVKDGLSAIGIESKGLDQVIGTAQAVLGVTSAVAGLTDAYEVLTATKKAKSAADVVEAGTTEAVAVAETEAAAATWSWNTALLANPIVLITAGVVAAAAAIYAFVKITGDAASEEEKAKVASLQLTQAIENQRKTFERNNKELQDNNNHKLALLKASGATEAQIYKETQALKAQEIQLAQNNRNELIRIEERAYRLNQLNGTDETKKALKVAQDALKVANDNILKGFDEVDKIRNDHEVAVKQAETDARKKAEEDAKKAREKADSDAKAANAKRLADRKKEIEEFKKLDEEIAENDANGKENQKKRDEEARSAKIQGFKDEADAQKVIQDKKKEDDAAELKAKQENQKQLVDSGEQLIKNVAALAGKNKAIQKAAIIADGAVSLGKAGVNTAEAVTKDLAKGAPFSAPLVALDLAVGATSAAAIIKNTASALKAVGGGGSGLSGGGTQSAPTRNVAQVGFQTSSENQISTSIASKNAEQPPLKAFVVSQDMTDQQNLDNQKLLKNSF